MWTLFLLLSILRCSSQDSDFEVTFINRFDFAVTVWWQDEANDPNADEREFHPQMVLQAGGVEKFGTFEGHIFDVYPEADGGTDGNLLARFIVSDSKLTYIVQEKVQQKVVFTNNFDQTVQMWYHDGNEAHPLALVQIGETFEDEAVPDAVYIATPENQMEPMLWKTLIHEDRFDYKMEL